MRLFFTNISQIFLARASLVLITCILVFPLSIGISWAETGFSGMFLQGLDKRTATALEMAEPEGVLVRDVAVGGPANMGGVLRGDLIINYVGKEIGTLKELVLVAGKTKPGQKISMAVVRAGKEVQLKLILGKKPHSWRFTKGAVLSIPAVGLTLAAMTAEIRKRFNMRWGSTGILVTLIDEKHADQQILERGDLITQVNQKDVWKPKQLLREYNEAKEHGRERILLLIERAGSFHYLLLPVR